MSESTSIRTQPAVPHENKAFAGLMESSRKKLLDLSLRNRLLNFAPANPDHQDDSRAHKFLVIKGRLKPVWERLVDDEKQLRISRFNPNEIHDRIKKLSEAARKPINSAESEQIKAQIRELQTELKEGEEMANEGHVWVEKIGDEAYQKRLRRLKDEAETLEDATGDSAFFLACAFLKWREKETRPRTAEEADEAKVFKFAPLVLVKISLTDEGRGTPGRRKFRIVHEDRPQDNQSLKAKLKDEWEFNLPDLGEDTHLTTYLASVKGAITRARLEGFEVHETMALGFFNFARYRLWLDLDPREWKTKSPDQHPIVRSIIGVTPLDTSCPPIVDATRDDALADEVARHQETEDIPIVRDADTSQYSALLYARKGKSIVVIGPPGSGKSQTITNLIATSIANGKRVLFVAQKLPALDVVASRIRNAGLGEFSLHFYSATREGVNERKPVSPVEIHQQLSAARHLLGTKSRQAPFERRAPILAKRLNAYATIVHGIHPVFGDSIQGILCSALKLTEDAITTWGEHWDESLLAVTLPEGGTGTEWMDARARLLSEVARLRHEAGEFWHGWRPDKLTVLDLPRIERSFESCRRSLSHLVEWTAQIGPELSDWTLAAIQGLSQRTKRLAAPAPCSDELLRTILGKPDMLRLAHELERELRIADSELEFGKTLLNLLPEGVEATARFTLSHLVEIERSTEGGATYDEAKKTLERLKEFVAITDRLLHAIPAQQGGISAFVGQEQPTIPISLIVSIAQQESGKFRRTPTSFLPQLARRLASIPDLGELGNQAVAIADQVDEFKEAQTQVGLIFAQAVRAEKAISRELTEAMKLACRMGLRRVAVAETKAAEASCRRLEETSSHLLCIESALAATITGTKGPLGNSCVENLALAAENVSETDLLLPQQGNARLVRAWANNVISESDARAAASAHERAAELARQILAIIGEASQFAETAEILEKASLVSESLGYPTASAIAEVLALRPLNAKLAETSERLFGWARTYTNVCTESTFGALQEAARLASVVCPVPSLSGVNPAKLMDRAALAELARASQSISSTHAQLVVGSAASLGMAANRIRLCLQAIQAAEQAASSVTGIRPPTTLRELRALGASLSTLRALPSLPVGCDVAQMAGEQHVASVRLLAATSTRIAASAAKLPSGFEYSMVPNTPAARQVIDDLVGTEHSPLRVFKGRWRAAKRAIKRCASKLEWDESVQAFRQAISIRAEEEAFAEDPAGKSLLGAYFRGSATNWTPFLAFATSIESLTRTLDGFERTDRVVAAWRNDASSFSAIATACARYEDAVNEGRTSMPDVFDGPESVFQADTPIAVARQKAAEILTHIERLLGSATLALVDDDAGSAHTLLLTNLIHRLDALERAVTSAASSACGIMGRGFTGLPGEWKLATSVAYWATKLHNEPALSAKLECLFEGCTTTPAIFAAIHADVRVVTSTLVDLRGKLAQSRVRPEDHESVQEFAASLTSTLTVFEKGADLVRGKPDARVVDIRECSRLIRQLIIESTRAERLRTAISPSLPSTVSVETSLAWAVKLDSQRMPKALVAFCAENPARVSDVRQLLLMSRDHVSSVRDARKCGFELWDAGEFSVDEGRRSAVAIAQGLCDARARLVECAAKPDRTVEEFLRGCEATLECMRFRDLIPTWTGTIGCDPFVAENPSEAVRETVFWVESLQTDRVPSALLSWIVETDSDSRTQWWADVVRTSKKWRSQRTNIREAALPESESDTLLDAWRRELSSREAALALALEQIARVVSSQAAPLSRVRAAAESLARSADAQARTEHIRRQLPGSELIQSGDVAEQHRLFSSALASMAIGVAPWALQVGAVEACRHLNALPQVANEVVESLTNLEDTISSFGSFEGTGYCGLPDKSVTLKTALEGVERAISNLHGLTSWAGLHRESKRAPKLGVERICTEVVRRKATPEQAVSAFTAAVAWQKALVVWKENPNLERFRTTRHEDLRSEFAAEDSKAVKSQNRHRIVEALRGTTSGGATSWGNGYVDQLLQHESTKRRKLLPVRKLVETAGKRMQELCPCWLATPAAIAQFMPPGAVEFDLVIMDEASQINPEDAWGAIARGTQVVVVGDPKQMPPSSFFENAATDDDQDDEPAPGANGEAPPPLLKGHLQESILKAAEACLPQVWLNWHYRSLHQGLIAPANLLSYDRRLVLFPSCHIDHRHLGVRYSYVPDGVATTGQVRNASEAGAIVNHLVEVAREFAQPQHRKLKKAPQSVGIIAMNIHQQETIKDLIEHRRTQEPAFDRDLRLLESNPTEPFFVRNLENVQGDERDVIVVSTTYGPATVGGTPTQRFFPINQEGGERRFNVLITRAKWRMDVFTSLRSSQLTSAQMGVQHMRAFLQYCESGCLPEKGVATERCFDSPFEAHVYAVLAAKGYSVEKQVGVAGYFVDLAIKDPIAPDRYILGIECDGAAYHSSRAARDRDRLREQVLAERGWKLHRIWSTEWFYNNASVRKNLFSTVESALSGYGAR